MSHASNAGILSRKIVDFCRLRLDPLLPPSDAENLLSYMLDLIARRQYPPAMRGGLHWTAIAEDAGIDQKSLTVHRERIRPAFTAIIRALDASAEIRTYVRRAKAPRRSKRTAPPKKRGPKPRLIEPHPTPLSDRWEDPASFSEALALHILRHGDTYWHLYRAVVAADESLDVKTIQSWMDGTKVPRSVNSLEMLGRIECRYRLPEGYFKAKLPHPSRAATGHELEDVGPAERRRLAWHLPNNFNTLLRTERETIVEWIRRVIISGATDYRRFQAAATKQRYAIRFRGVSYNGFDADSAATDQGERPDEDLPDADNDLRQGVIDAPPRLAAEMADLVRFKTSTLTTMGLQRNGVWGEETTSQKIEHLGLMFGALAASPRSAVCGYGVPVQRLTFGLLAFPAVWDWYVQWRERRRGFYTAWEVDMLRIGLAMARQETGWLRQNRHLIERVRPIPGLVSQADIDTARADWGGACETFFKHATGRVKEIQRVVRVHRDPFEPILVVLEAPSPVGEYRKITEEILRRIPNERRYPRAAAEAVRSFLLLRLGLHLGLRQKNLRQLMVCPRGQAPRSERQLADMKRGELRWSDRDAGWEVLIPAVAFKNATSSFFGNKPFRLVLPDLGGLYDYLEAYIDRHRAVLLAGARDPGTFFVKTVKTTSANAAYCQTTFYEAWRLTIQRYGIYNPYTGRGAIKGLLPHGPHNVRDVLATHILKQTGSYEQASYAIQDTPDMVAQHYGRFLPQDKAALAAKILNQAWEAA